MTNPDIKIDNLGSKSGDSNQPELSNSEYQRQIELLVKEVNADLKIMQANDERSKARGIELDKVMDQLEANFK